MAEALQKIDLTDYAWYPQPGPQTAAFTARWCTELFYGGARGGGKSDFLLGDFLQDVEEYGQYWRGVLFRRTYDELEEIITRSHEIFPQTGAEWRAVKRTWEWQNGAYLKMRYLERMEDAARYQGHQYCVVVGTPILMSDGSSKPIEEIKIGDYVATLEGAKPVIHAISPYQAPCVTLKTPYGEQQHPIWHRVLTASGWKSYASLLEIDSKEFVGQCQEFSQHLSVNCFVRCLKDYHGQRVDSANTSKQCCYPYISYLMSLLKDLAKKQLSPLTYVYRRHIHELLQLLFCHSALPCVSGGVLYAQRDWQIIANCLNDYHLNCYSYDEQLQTPTKNVLNGTPLLSDVALPYPDNCKRDALGNIPRYSLSDVLTYEHPYTYEVRQASEENVFVPCKMTPMGQKLVCDISVKDANHYITYNTGVVNSNSWISFDELTNWNDPAPYDAIKACLRSAHMDIPVKRIRASGNPGGAGHTWVKQRFVDPAPLGFTPFKNEVTGMTTMYVPARVSDNQRLMEKDPTYVGRLRASGSPELVRCWLEGDWNVVVGAYFSEFSILKHVVEPFAIPAHWLKFCSFDWGSYSPFSVIWWAVSDGTISDYPRGALIAYREWYGAEKANKGLKMANEDIAKGILEREHESITYRVADPSIFEQKGGISIAEQMHRAGITWRPGDNKRVAGWSQLRSRLIGSYDKPMIYWFATCTDSIRTIPALQHDRHKPEDLDTESEDHAADSIRYACMSRPWTQDAPEVKPNRTLQNVTYNDLLLLHDREQKRHNIRRAA